MKRKIINVLTGLLFLIGFGILVYPRYPTSGIPSARAV